MDQFLLIRFPQPDEFPQQQPAVVTLVASGGGVQSVVWNCTTTLVRFPQPDEFVPAAIVPAVPSPFVPTTATTDSIPMIFMGMDELLLIDAGMINEGGSLNIPWLVAASSQMGNAYTEGLSRTANVCCEIEAWEGMGGGGNQANYNGPWRQAMGHGMMSIWW